MFDLCLLTLGRLFDACLGEMHFRKFRIHGLVYVCVVLLVGFLGVSNRIAIIVVLETPVSPHFASGIFIVHVWAGGSG